MRVHIGLGSNLGDRVARLAEALDHIAGLPQTELLAVSHAYESEAWPPPSDLPYANAVAVVATELPAPELLAELRRIEREMGRDQWAPRNSPRGIDLDILLAGDEEWDRQDLTVPHPRMAERDFVITPLLEVDPGATWPDGSVITRDHVRVGRVTRVLGPLPGGAGMPDPSGDWVEIARFRGRANIDTAEAAEIAFATAMLSSAGIPFVLDPPQGSEGAGPYPLPVSSGLLVPPERATEAREFLAEAKAAPFDFSDAYRLAEESPAEADLLEDPDAE